MANNSPYLADEERLADVIAAIQTLGPYKFYKTTIAQWAQRIGRPGKGEDHWRQVFSEHPEFFRISPTDPDRVSLVIRRHKEKRYNVDTDSLISKAEYDAMNSIEQRRVTRAPLNSAEVQELVDNAIKLHTRAVETGRDRRWWFVPAIGLVGVFGGAILKSLFE